MAAAGSGDDELVRAILRERVRRRWATVDAAVRAAYRVELTTQASRAIDYASMAVSLPDYRGREPTVLSTGQGGAMGPAVHEANVDRGKVIAVVEALDDPMPKILTWTALGAKRREVEARLRQERGSRDKTLTAILLRMARERAGRRLVELGLIEPMKPLSTEELAALEPSPRATRVPHVPSSRATSADEELAPREPRCECQFEVGDSPCPVHGDDEGEA